MDIDALFTGEVYGEELEDDVLLLIAGREWDKLLQLGIPVVERLLDELHGYSNTRSRRHLITMLAGSTGLDHATVKKYLLTALQLGGIQLVKECLVQLCQDSQMMENRAVEPLVEFLRKEQLSVPVPDLVNGLDVMISLDPATEQLVPLETLLVTIILGNADSQLKERAQQLLGIIDG
ncbi:MAG: hypothetical protein ACFFD4_19030 [Candidatus Odinarchaeota archaeon]